MLILISNLTDEEAYEEEKKLIHKHKPRANLVEGGKGFSLGNKVPLERRIKIANTLKGRPLSAERKQKISLSLKGKEGPRKRAVLSEETKRKIGLKSLGRISKRRKKVFSAGAFCTKGCCQGYVIPSGEVQDNLSPNLSTTFLFRRWVCLLSWSCCVR